MSETTQERAHAAYEAWCADLRAGGKTVSGEVPYSAFVAGYGAAALLDAQEGEATGAAEAMLRRLLWLRHGCRIATLYGDDGEMSCGTCRIDFLRASPDEIDAAFKRVALTAPEPSEPESNEAGVPAVCSACGWRGEMLTADVLDHPCPSCGRYTRLRRDDDGHATPASSEPTTADDGGELREPVVEWRDPDTGLGSSAAEIVEGVLDGYDWDAWTAAELGSLQDALTRAVEAGATAVLRERRDAPKPSETPVAEASSIAHWIAMETRAAVALGRSTASVESEGARQIAALASLTPAASEPRPTPADDGGVRDRPEIICLSGSSRFVDKMAVMAWELEKSGAIVLSLHLLPRWYCGDVDDHIAEAQGVAEAMDELHLRKIDLADKVFVMNVGGYIGDSTRREIEYADRLGKSVMYLEPIDGAAPATGERAHESGDAVSEGVDGAYSYREARGGYLILGPLEEGPRFEKHDIGLPGPRQQVIATVHGDDMEIIAQRIVAALRSEALGGDRGGTVDEDAHLLRTMADEIEREEQAFRPYIPTGTPGHLRRIADRLSPSPETRSEPQT